MVLVQVFARPPLPFFFFGVVVGGAVTVRLPWPAEDFDVASDLPLVLYVARRMQMRTSPSCPQSWRVVYLVAPLQQSD